MGANGLINEKQEEKISKYCYNHWVESKDVDFINIDKERLEVQLIKALWIFDFQKAYDIANIIYADYEIECRTSFANDNLK
jgi:hypothetical protein